MSQKTNKQVVLEYVEAFNRGDLDALRDLFTPDALVYGVLGWGGIDAVAPIWRELHESFALKLKVEALSGEGDTVAARYSETGASVRPFRQHPATGKSFETVAMEWFLFQDGRIHRRWGARDSASQFRQMGLSLS
jgi:steroid delta-isomerase-like uncharacterized protein